MHCHGDYLGGIWVNRSAVEALGSHKVAALWGNHTEIVEHHIGPGENASAAEASRI